MCMSERHAENAQGQVQITSSRRLPWWAWVVFVALLSLVAMLGAIPAAEKYRLAESSYGASSLMFLVQTAWIFLLLAALGYSSLAIVGLLFRKTRVLSVFVLSYGVFIVLGFFAASHFSMTIRMKTFERLGERSMPLVSAIHRFCTDSGRPPQTLSELVPAYLEQVPRTGIAAYPEFDYVSGEDALLYFDANPWAIFVRCPFTLFNWDRFLYLPRKNYPLRGYGGTLERLGDWAYVHE